MRCSECKHLYSDEGFSGTEVTGATPADLHCMKGHWDFDFTNARVSLRLIAKIGDNCADFANGCEGCARVIAATPIGRACSCAECGAQYDVDHDLEATE